MDPQLEEPDLRSYLRIIARRRWFVVLTTLVFVGIAILASVIPKPSYRVRAEVLTQGPTDPVTLLFGGNPTGDLESQRNAQLAFLRGSTMRFNAARAYNGRLSDGEVFKVSATPVGGAEDDTSSVVALSLVSTDPDEAQTLVNIYANTYVELRQSLDAEKMINVTRQLSEFLQSVEQQMAEIRRPITELQDQLVAETDPVASLALRDRLTAEEDRLAPQLEPLASQAAEFRRRIGDLQFGVELTTGGGAEVISLAGSPDAPISPNLPRNLAIGLVFGLFLGIALAFIRDYFDDSLKSKEMAEQVTGVPTLGLIPKFEGDAELVTVAQPSSPAAEAFRSLRTSVKFLGVDRSVRVLQVTSSSAAEGKSLVAVNLAVAFAQAGDRVVLVGADLRRPHIEEMLDIPLNPGLTAVLIGDVTLPQAIQNLPAVANLSVLPAGYPPPNPSELLSGERAKRLVDVLGQTYDVVVIDCPPVLPVTDSLVLAHMVDTTLLVTSVNKTSKRSLHRAVELLRQVDAPLVGTVLNSLPREASYGDKSYRYEPVSLRGRGGGTGEGTNGFRRPRRRRKDRAPAEEWPTEAPTGS